MKKMAKNQETNEKQMNKGNTQRKLIDKERKRENIYIVK